MRNRIINYQKAFSEAIEPLEKNEHILAIFTFGSVVNGDIWEESDIDLFTICDGDFTGVRDVYSKVRDIPIHNKYVSKKTFLKDYLSNGKKELQGITILTSKLVSCKDKSIIKCYNDAKYLVHTHSKSWNLVYFGDLLKEVGIVRKYLHNNGIYTAYEVLIRCLTSFSRLYINLNGYSVTRDAIKICRSLNNDFNEVVEELFNNRVIKENIESCIDYIEKYVKNNVITITEALLEYLRERDTYLSAYELGKDDKFLNFNIRFEVILKDLTKRGILKDSKRKSLIDNSIIVEEITYGIG